MRRAVVDVGSNSVLLTVSEGSPGDWRELKWTSEVTGLGEGTKATGLLKPEAQARTLEAVARAFGVAQGMGADCAAAATMAVRIATNAGEFLRAAERQGTPIAVLSGDEEAEFGLEAVMNDPIFAGFERVSVIDPGGHSTELTTAARRKVGWDVEFQRSFAVGALGLREGPMGADKPDRAAQLRAVCEIDDLLGLQSLPGMAGVAVGLGATPTNLANIRQLAVETPSLALPPGGGNGVHGTYLDYEEVSRSVERMCGMTEAERAAVPGMEKGREKTLHIGALILERFLNALHVEGCYVSVRGWRWAMLDRDVYFR